MFLLIALAAVATPPPAAEQRISLGPLFHPRDSNSSELTLTASMTTGRLRSVIRVDRTTLERVRLIRHGNAEGNIEKRVIRSFDGSHVHIDKFERHVSKKWVDAGRIVTVFIGGRWTGSLELVDGSASLWVTYFHSDSEAVAIGYDLTGGLLLRVRLWDIND